VFVEQPALLAILERWLSANFRAQTFGFAHSSACPTLVVRGDFFERGHPIPRSDHSGSPAITKCSPKLATEYPFKNKVLTVLASDRYDAKAGFSNYGASTVHLAAPGTDILATGLYLEPPARYASYSGTSPAAAFASSAAALVFALNPAWRPEDVGRIRLTPVAGNFPVVSETFRVV
jgi:subtilisin family serine protease